jgi:hypothetical protein
MMGSNGLCSLFDKYSFCEENLAKSIDIDCPGLLQAKCIEAGERNGEIQRVCTDCVFGVKLPNGDCAATCDIGTPGSDGICYCTTAATEIMQINYTYKADGTIEKVEAECATTATLAAVLPIPDNCASVGKTGKCTGCAEGYSLNLLKDHEEYGTCMQLSLLTNKCAKWELVHGYPMCLKCKADAIFNEEKMMCVDCSAVGCQAGCASYFTE